MSILRHSACYLYAPVSLTLFDWGSEPPDRDSIISTNQHNIRVTQNNFTRDNHSLVRYLGNSQYKIQLLYPADRKTSCLFSTCLTPYCFLPNLHLHLHLHLHLNLNLNLNLNHKHNHQTLGQEQVSTTNASLPHSVHSKNTSQESSYSLKGVYCRVCCSAIPCVLLSGVTY